jgi:Ca2+-transporting ATPase
MAMNPFSFSGLPDADVAASRARYGTNEIRQNSHTGTWAALKETVTEPMFVLLVAAASVYFILGEITEGIYMLAALAAVAAISFYQDSRSRKALQALQDYTQPLATVIRNNEVTQINSRDVVVGDFVVMEEGTLVPADGEVVQANDFTVNESILTGEAFTVTKSVTDATSKRVFQGTLVTTGLAVMKVTTTGDQTELGKIGKSLREITDEKTPLQKQMDVFVRKMALAGGAVFLLIWGYQFIQSRELLGSLLMGLTIAMSVLPEEIPVAFTTFMALGAWRLMKEGIIVKQTKTVETLGAATVLCVDKTGTITENRMELKKIVAGEHVFTCVTNKPLPDEAQHVLEMAMWASEPVPFDPMEKALHQAYNSSPDDKRIAYTLTHEYPLGGQPPMMTHVFSNAKGHQIIAAKGAVEAVMRQCQLSPPERQRIHEQHDSLSAEGYRVLAVATAPPTSELPQQQHEFEFQYLGLIAFYDPPKPHIQSLFEKFQKAGIRIKVITGDSVATTRAIAQQAGLPPEPPPIQGEELLKLSPTRFDEEVKNRLLFTRMFPEAKLRIIESLKKQGEIVAMTGDGVNDGPALKAAHIGIAMGKRGSEIARQASALILTTDDLSQMVAALAMGRKIYSNLKKAVQYIISIHIPIILTVAAPLLLGWMYPAIFTPIHVIFLELIMGPTCSIVYENEPLEPGSMEQPPRQVTQSFLNFSELSISIGQGLVITLGTLTSYQLAVQWGYSEELTRSMVFTTLVVANIVLTLVNRSFYHSVLVSARYNNWMLRAILISTIGLLAIILYVDPISQFFHVRDLSAGQLGISALIGFLSVIWFELVKWRQRHRKPVQSIS